VFTDSPGKVQRSDWTLHGAWAPAPALLAEGWRTSGSVSTGDSTMTLPFLSEARGQYGGRVSAGTGPVWGRATARFNDGRGIPDRELSLEMSAVSQSWGGANALLRRESWEDLTGGGYELRAWFNPISHVAFFAEQGRGARAVPYLLPPLPDEPEDTTLVDEEVADSLENMPRQRFTERTGTRYGARAAWRGLAMSGARITAEADSIWPTQLLFDRDGLVIPQPRRQGWELTGHIPLRPRGLQFVGEVQLWEHQDSVTPLYFPDHVYRGSLSFHRVFRESGNFEMWVDLGAQGRSRMNVPLGVLPEPYAEDEPALVPDVVPFYQSWFFRLQMRFLTLNIFLTVNNLNPRPENQDVPGRLLPTTRGLYGVRWVFRN